MTDILDEIHRQARLDHIKHRVFFFIQQFIEAPSDARASCLEDMDKSGRDGDYGTGFGFLLAQKAFNHLTELQEKLVNFEWVIQDEEQEIVYLYVAEVADKINSMEKDFFIQATKYIEEYLKKKTDEEVEKIAQMQFDDDGSPPVEWQTKFVNSDDDYEDVDIDEDNLDPLVKGLYQQMIRAKREGRSGFIPLLGETIPTPKQLKQLKKLIARSEGEIRMMGVIRMGKNGIEPI